MQELKWNIEEQTSILKAIMRNTNIKMDQDDFEHNYLQVENQKRRHSAARNSLELNNPVFRNILIKQLVSSDIEEENEH